MCESEFSRESITVDDMKPDKISLICDNIIRLLVSGSIASTKAISDLQKLRNLISEHISLGEGKDLEESLRIIDLKIDKLTKMNENKN